MHFSKGKRKKNRLRVQFSWKIDFLSIDYNQVCSHLHYHLYDTCNIEDRFILFSSVEVSKIFESEITPLKSRTLNDIDFADVIQFHQKNDRYD